MSALFSAKREDGRAEWRVVFDAIENLDRGTLVTFEQLKAMLETVEKPRVYNAVREANRRLWAKSQRSLGIVRGVGYRVLQPEEHELQASGYQRTAQRRLNNAVSVMKATDVSRMNPRARDWVLQVTAGMVLMARSIDDHRKRLAQHDDLITELAKRITRLEDDKE